MKLSFVLLSFLLCSSCLAQNYAPGYYVRTFAGSQIVGNLNAQGSLARFYNPTYQVADAGSNLYIWDAGNNRIRKITPAGVVSTLPGTANAVGQEMQMDGSGNIWSLTPSGLSQTSTNGFTAFIPLSLGFQSQGFCVDNMGRFFALNYNQVIQFDTAGNQSVYAGSGNFDVVDGNGANASFNGLYYLAADNQGNLYVTDNGLTLIRKIDTGRNVTTVGGVYGNTGPSIDGPVSTATFWGVQSLAIGTNGDIFVTVLGVPYSFGTAIRRISGGQVQTLAGSFYNPLPFDMPHTFVNGAGADARFFGVFGLAPAGDRLFVTDFGNNCVREISTNAPSVVGPTTLAISVDGQSTLSVTADIGSVLEILSSPDLQTWSAVDTLLVTNTPSLWSEAKNGNTFYRTLLLQ